MSASASTAAVNYPRTFSLGPVKIQFFDVTHISGDTTCTITGDRMHTAIWGFLASSVVQTAAPTYSGAAITYTFTNPAASVYAQAVIFGL